jgi:hypothetical protein
MPGYGYRTKQGYKESIYGNADIKKHIRKKDMEKGKQTDVQEKDMGLVEAP